MKEADTPLVDRTTDDHTSDSFEVGPGEVIAFHRVLGCDETWTLVAGGPLEVHVIHADGRHEARILSAGTGQRGPSATTIEAGSLRVARLVAGGGRASLRRAAGRGHRSRAVEFPGSDEILRQHPLHRAIVVELTAG